MFDPLSLCKVLKRLCICQTKSQSIITMALQWNRPTCHRGLTYRLVGWSSPVAPKVWIKTHIPREGSKNGSRRGDLTGVVDFQRYHCLSASVCSVDTWEKSILLTLKTNLATCCQKSSTQSVFFNTLFDAWVTTRSPNLCCNHSAGVALECAVHHERNVSEQKHYIYVAWTSNNRVISRGELYCCLLPQCEALHTRRSGFPIATLRFGSWSKSLGTKRSLYKSISV